MELKSSLSLCSATSRRPFLQRNQRGSRQSHPPPPGAARKVDTERVGVGGRQSADSLAGHRPIPTTARGLIPPPASMAGGQEGGGEKYG